VTTDNLQKHSAHGANQTGVRLYNERLLLTMLQRQGEMPASDLARRAGLSPQTVSVILRKMENDGLIERGDPLRGRVGKPSVPMRLAADGALSYGVKIGRRTADLVVMNLHGEVHRQISLDYAYPLPDMVLEFMQDGIADLYRALPMRSQDRLCGLGIAAPFELWNWTEKVGAPESFFDAWKDTDLPGMLRTVVDLPVAMVNDATAACQAEHVFGNGKAFRDYAYLFIGAFIGGGIVLNNSVFEGNQKNAGAVGPMRMGRRDGSDTQLIDTASLYLLENALEAAGHDKRLIWDRGRDWSTFRDVAQTWISETAQELARASLTFCSVVDFEAILIDGIFPADVRASLVAQTREAMMALDRRGLITPRIEAGRVGPNARAIGAAYYPISTRFLLNTNSVFASEAVAEGENVS
jgi:predicted NBD/HSP70 family sugar kinase